MSKLQWTEFLNVVIESCFGETDVENPKVYSDEDICTFVPKVLDHPSINKGLAMEAAKVFMKHSPDESFRLYYSDNNSAQTCVKLGLTVDKFATVAKEILKLTAHYIEVTKYS